MRLDGFEHAPVRERRADGLPMRIVPAAARSAAPAAAYNDRVRVARLAR